MSAPTNYRAARFNQLSRAGQNRLVQASYGFANTQQLEAALFCAAKLARGERIGDAEIRRIEAAYPSVVAASPRFVRDQAAVVNRAFDAHGQQAAHDALTHALGFKGEDARTISRSLTESYMRHDIADAISAKRGAEPPETASARKEREAHPTFQHNADAASRRAVIAARMADTSQFAGLSGREATQHLKAATAGEIAHNTDALDKMAAWHQGYRPAADVPEPTRADSVAAAYDLSAAREIGGEIEAAGDVDDVISEANSQGDTSA
jgi:hypothetical protein